MFSQKISARIDMIDKTNLLAIVLMGSYARGEAGKFSDIDVVCFLKENAKGETPLIEIVDGKYLVISTVTTEEADSWFSEPEKATEGINGLRAAVPIWDPTGYVAGLQASALRFVWDEALQHKANIYASKSLLGWGEEVHKALQGVITGDIGRMLNGLHGLTFGIFKVVRVQRGILLSGDNYFFDEVIDHFGHQSEFARLSKIAFGIDEAVTLRERVLAGLELFCLVVDMLADDMSEEVKDDVMFIAAEVREEIMMKQHETVSFCGIYCGGCKNYKENLNCMGCRYEENLVNDCPTRSCAINKGLLHCGECADFPCSELHDFYHDGIPHHEVALQNILRIRESGVDKWLLEQANEHTCECGRRKFWFAAKCTKCNHSI